MVNHDMGLPADCGGDSVNISLQNTGVFDSIYCNNPPFAAFPAILRKAIARDKNWRYKLKAAFPRHAERPIKNEP
jgi:hypothetical protein